MRIIGCDLHARQQSVAMFDSETGEVVNRTLMHEGNEVREFYSRLPRPVLVGIEAIGPMQWFLNPLEELGIEAKDTLLVLNKVDRLENNADLLVFQSRFPDSLALSAKTGRGVPTIDLRVDYHRAAMPGVLTVRGEIVNFGRQFSVAEAKVFDHEGRLLASGRGTYLTAPPA